MSRNTIAFYSIFKNRDKTKTNRHKRVWRHFLYKKHEFFFAQAGELLHIFAFYEIIQ